MATSKKPRKKYIPKPVQDKSSFDREYLAFTPLYECLESLKNEILDKGGEWYFKSSIGFTYHIEATLRTWGMIWESISKGENLNLDTSDLIKLSNKINYKMVLQLSDIEAAKKSIDQTRLAYRSLKPSVTASYMNTELIKIELNKNKKIPDGYRNEELIVTA